MFTAGTITVIAVAVESFVSFGDKGEARIGEPAADLRSIRVVVVSAGTVADILAVDGRCASLIHLREGTVELSSIDLLDRQVEMASRPDRPLKVDEDALRFAERAGAALDGPTASAEPTGLGSCVSATRMPPASRRCGSSRRGATRASCA